MKRLILCLAVALGLASPSVAQTDRDNGGGRPIVGNDYPVSFRAEHGGRFQPDTLIILGQRTMVAPLPSQAGRVDSTDHVDISSLPLLGQFFRERRAPEDVESMGLPVGRVFRKGDTLIIDARGHRQDLTRFPLSLTTDLPRVGPLKFTLGQLKYRPGTAPRRATPVGQAYLLENRLWLVSDGKRPPLSGRL